MSVRDAGRIGNGGRGAAGDGAGSKGGNSGWYKGGAGAARDGTGSKGGNSGWNRRGVGNTGKDGGGKLSRSWVRDAVVTLLLFAVFREWLAPLAQLTDMTEIYSIKPFLIAFGLFMLITYFGLGSWTGAGLKAFICLALSGYLHAPGVFPGPAWWSGLLPRWADDAMKLVTGQAGSMAAETRTMLFTGGWAIVVSIVHSMALHRRIGGWFIVLTLAYLAALPMLFRLDTSYAILRVLGAGMLLQTLLLLPRLEGRSSRRSGQGTGAFWPIGWLASGAIAIACVLAVSVVGSRLLEAEDATAKAWGSQGGWPQSLQKFLEPYIAGQGSALARTGYSQDDSSLGGPVKADETVVFVARTPQLTYWRGEAKSEYTGRGWQQPTAIYTRASGQAAATKQSDEVEKIGAQAGVSGQAVATKQSEVTEESGAQAGASGQSAATKQSDEAEKSDAQAGVNGQTATTTKQADVAGESDAQAGVSGQAAATTKQADVAGESAIQAGASITGASWLDPTSAEIAQEVMPKQAGIGRQLFAAGSIASVDWMLSEAGKPIASGLMRVDAQSGRAMLPSRTPALGYYKARSVPVPAAGRVDGGSAEGQPLPEELRRQYTQLPPALPGRVAELARDVAAKAAAAPGEPFAQAQALAAYLSAEGGYAYSLDRARPVPQGVDFVDSFLFEQKVGYCDYFSTSMVVMLRTLGIPARWVKGYAPGTVVGDEWIDGTRIWTVEVRSSDAHSWVEAYIAGAGWLRFEPTPGFAAAAALPAPEPAAAAALAGAARPAPAAPASLLRAAPSLRSIALGAAALASAALAVAAARAALRAARSLAAEGPRRAGPRIPAVRLLQRLLLRWTRRHGPRAATQTIREYVSSRAFAHAQQQEAAAAFARLIEAASYGGAAAPQLTKRQVLGVWRALRRKP